MDVEFWNERYRESHRIWSGAPNPQLVTEVSALAPGKALDIGCGEGADSIWLASRGWEVTGVDFAQAALDKGAEEAAERGLSVTWLCKDLLNWRPSQEFDLVSAQFFHLQPDLLGGVLTRLSRAVVAGGTFLVVGHNPRDLVTHTGHQRRVDVLFAPEVVVDLLDADQWEISVAEGRSRPIELPDGETFTYTDTVVRAKRR